MTDVPATPEKVTPTTAAQPSNTSTLLWWVREVLAAVLWSFFFVKLFVYDVDIFLLQRLAPRFLPLLAFKFFALIGSIAFLWLILGNDRFRSFVAYVLLYPFVVMLWKIPKWLFRNWAVTIAFSPTIHSLVTTFRFRFIAGAFAILAALTISVSTNSVLTFIAMLILGVYICAHHFQRFRIVFQPSSVFADIAQLVRKVWEHFRETGVEKELSAAAQLDRNSEEYKQKHRQNLVSMFLQVLALQFLAGKLRGVAASRKIDLYFLAVLVYTFLLTAVVFAFEYWALEKVQPGSFKLPGATLFWPFLAFSFGTLLPPDLSGVFPRETLAMILSYLELFARFVILIIFVSVLFAILRERYREDMDKVIEELDRSVATLDGLIRREYSLSLEEAEAALIEGNPEFVKTIALFRG